MLRKLGGSGNLPPKKKISGVTLSYSLFFHMFWPININVVPLVGFMKSAGVEFKSIHKAIALESDLLNTSISCI
jgi:hypothetical protein